MYAITLNSFQHFSNSLLCASSWICTIAEANNVAFPQHLRPACVQLRHLSAFWPKATHIPHPFKLLRWELASFSWTFHCRALPMGRITTRDIFLLRHPEHPGVQCESYFLPDRIFLLTFHLLGWIPQRASRFSLHPLVPPSSPTSAGTRVLYPYCIPSELAHDNC